MNSSEVLRIALVDDDNSVRKALSRLLKSVGFEVTVFSSGEDFLRHCWENKPDCLVLDMYMPQQDGLEVQRLLLDSGENYPIIFITAHDDPLLHTRAIEAGAVGYYQKPVADEVLIAAILSAAKQSGSRIAA